MALTQAEVGQELTRIGLKPIYDFPQRVIKEFEVHGAGKVHIVEVYPNGRIVFRDGRRRPKKIWAGYVEEREGLLVRLTEFGHCPR
jgi:hypothetical protein